ncbi:hypothetical protein ACFPYI_21315 [Halomarina salina]|uniref:Small CPxCG-related zinc finger protein n=1 Tax=Halomarina salina TaxID=1872699 RepID=A0ABD5RTE7_9EURY|nr:hypothetical protein [Halomarina salina]
MPQCTHCSGHISQRFMTVFGDENSQVYACPNCSANAGIAEVARLRAGTKWQQ